jgi:tetratricopeptide (TPR) repeat protein
MKKTTTTRGALLGLILGGLAALAGTETLGAQTQEEAAATFAHARVLLAKADFDGALAAFAAAAKADPQNQDYRSQYALVRRVMNVRVAIEREEDTARWAVAAQALRSFYYDHGIHREALSLDRQRHVRIGGIESATLLAETQLELDMNAETAALLGAFEPEDLAPRSRALLGIALARLERFDEAEAIARACANPEGINPVLCFDLARLHSLLGDREAAANMLTHSFESTLPSRLDAVKDRARTHADLSALASSAEFAAVFSTTSKVSESSCSGGAGCGSCPSRGTCGSGQQKSGS